MNKNKSYILGIIGGIIGGFIATIPWILMYVYGEMILSLLAIIIALGTLKGYQLFRGKVDNKLPIIIVIISCICITFSTLLIIPYFLLIKEGEDATLNNIIILYEYKPFFNAIIKDYIISLLFTFIGISGIINNLKKQISEGNTENLKVSISNNELKNKLNEDKEKLKKVFLELDATSKERAISKSKILENLEDPNDKSIFNSLKMQQIVLKYRGNYYYSLKNDQSFMRRFIRIYLKIMLWFTITLIIIFVLIALI